MNLILKNKKRIFIACAIIVLIALLSTLVVKHVDNKSVNLNPEILRSMNYTQITDEDSKVENTDFVKFSAFFTRDLNGDGNAEKLLGTCRNINSTDQLYMDLNVLTNGYLKDGVIKINGTNFKYSMNMVKDSVLKNNYISEDVKTIELKQVKAGTQKLIIGDVLAYIGDDINNYSNISSITLTGTHVSDEGVETPISKTIDLTIDWHGTTRASLYMNYQATSFTYYYDDLDTTTISFNFRLDELQKELILKENVATITIPELNGYAPTEVKCTNSNVESNYNSGTKVLELKRSSICNENGIVTSSLSRSNTYTINVTYPQEAYEQITGYKQLTIPVTGYYTGYNNVNKEFTNPYKSNEVNSNLTLIFKSKPTDKIYNFSVDFMDKTRVSKPDYRYVVSKQDILNYYDNEDEVKNKEYVVRWLAIRGTAGEVPSMIMSETKDGNTYGDKWNNTIMQDYVINTGIYFENANQMLEADGSISVYNNDTNELIHTFTKEEWNKYNRNNPYKYENPVRHIRVETTKTNLNSTLGVYNIKELEVSKVLEDFTKDQVKDINNIYTYLTGVCNIVGQNAGIINDIDYANYVSEKSDTGISVSSYKLSTQETIENQKIYIRTVSSQVGDAKWKNGEFLVEMPQEIANMEINSINATDDVKIIAYDLFEQDGRYFIKIITENENPNTYTITIDCNMTPDPRTPTTDKEIKLYSYNENCNDYYFETKDIYDVDSDNNTQEKVGISNTKLSLISPTSLITLETISNYNDKNKTTVAPNVAAIEKETRNATINVSFTNNYTNTVSGIQILGKIPFEGNTYILNGKDLKSKFTTTMTNAGITIPQELQGKAKIYYSENENPSKDLLDENNGWKLKENVQDFSKIKTYFIDLKESSIDIGKGYTFTYIVNVQENLDYNLASYSNHTVYYELNTEGGNLSLSTEPNKVGIRVSRKIDFELTKYKEGTENLTVPGATYTLEVSEDEETTKTRILTTNNEGKIQVKNIYIGLEYTIKELRSPSEYKLNDEVIKFMVVEENGNLKLQSESENIVVDQINNIVKIKVEDEPKYNLNITKIDESTKEPIERIVFSAGGKNGITDRNGIATIEKLELNKQYTLKEGKSDSYYRLEDINFELVKDENGTLRMVSENEIFKNAIIENNDKEDLINVSLTLTNEKIPTYNLQILKVKENFEETDIEKLEPLQGAKFRITSEDNINKEDDYITGEDGIINIYNLYQFVEGKYITGNYTLQEVQAPDGYANNAEEIKFRVSKNADNALEIEIQEKDNLETIKDVIVEEDTIKVIIQNKPLFKLTKIDNTTGKPLANAKFAIYEIDEEGHELGYAKDVNGNYVGELDENGQYIITTDQSGTIILPLKGGQYKAVEVEFPEGYEENITEEIFKVEDGNEEDEKDEEQTEGMDVVEINYIEDLVKLSNDVNSGNKYENTIVKLNRTLDFNQQSSYRNYQDTSYGDVNGVNGTETIMEELTNKDGGGFTPIGQGENSFSGTLDGKNYEIKNLYMCRNLTNGGWSYVGLFGSVTNGKIKNIGVTGNISHGVGYTWGYIGGIVGNINNGIVENCNNKCNINSISCAGIGGIAGNSENSSFINCYNVGKLDSPSLAGGIVGKGSSSFFNCYNEGKLNSTYGTGGILGEGSSSFLNCYNVGEVYAESYYCAGIVANGGSSISNCYNIGTVICGDGSRGGIVFFAGGIAGDSAQHINNCYNMGTIICTNTGHPAAGGIVGRLYGDISNCYNTGDIISTNSGSLYGGYAGYIIGYMGSTNISNCFFLEDINIIRTEVINENSIPISREQIKSKEFYNTLNVDNVWEYRPTKYPVLFTIPVNVRNTTEITIENSMKEFEITTEIGVNSESKRVGGTISGEYRSEDMNFVENVRYKENSTQEIKVKATDDYHIVKILINDEEVDFLQTGDREFSLPEGYFKEITEDKHIVVIFEPINNFIINKVDEDDTNKVLEGAKFTIEKQISPNELMLETKSNSSYPFILHYSSNKPYNSSNNGVSNSVSSSYVPIDLRNYDEKFLLSVNAYISSESNCDIGYAAVTESIITPSYSDSTNRFIYISGSVSSNTYTKELEGGKLYYLHVGYRKDGSVNTGSDRFTISSINLATENNTPIYKDSILTTDSEGRIATRLENNLNYRITETQAPVGYALKSETQTIQIQNSEVKELTFTNKKEQETAIITKVDKETNEPIPNTKFAIYNMSNTFETIDFVKDSSGQYMGELNDGIYTIKTDKNGQIRLSLPDGYYKAVEVESSEGYIFEEDETKRTTYFKIGNVTSDFDDRYLTDKEITITNTKKSENNITIKKIDSETKQKLAGARFRLQNTSSKNNLIGAMVSNSQYSFVKNGTQYYSNNKGIHDSVANAYFPIDLRQYEGTFNLSVNYSISSQSNNDIGYATITTSEDIPEYNQSSGNINTSYRFIYTSGSYSNYTSSISLTGGKKYYLHIGYRKNASTNTGNDTFYINNINLTYSTEVETNSEGIVSVKAPIGNYSITETKAPLGYELNSTSQNIEISDTTQTYELTFENTKQQIDFNKPNFTLTKKDKVTDNVMPGVKFMILDENGNYVEDYTGTIVGEKEEINGEEKYVITTDENGQIKLKLKIGKYKLVEVQTYDGYVIDDEKEFEITNENVDYELSCKGEIISTYYPWKNYIRATSDGGIIQTNYGTNKTIPAEKTLDNKEIQVVSDKGYIVKYNNNGKIEKLIQIDGFQYGTEVYEDSDGNYIVLGSGTKIEIPADNTVEGKEITLSYVGTNSRTIILKLNKEFKVIWAKKIDDLSASSTSMNYIGENENGDYIINLANYSGSSIVIPAKDTIDGQEINLQRNNSCAFMEYTKDGKVKSVHQISPTINSLVEKENGGYLISNYNNIYELDHDMNVVKQYSNNISGISLSSSYSTWVTKDEGFVVGGMLTNSSVTISGDNTANGEEIQITSDTLADAVLIKYNKDFKIEWVKVNSWTSGPGEGIYNIKQDLEGNYVALLRINSSPTQYKLLKYDTNGNIISEIELSNSLMTTDYLYTDKNNTQFIILDGSQNKFLNYRLGVQNFNTIDINMTNQKAGKVIVHHYLEGTGPEYGTEPVTFEEAPDEILTGKVPDEYTTSPNMNIKEYTLIKDENGEYVIPENASGNFTEEDQHVYYYYNKKQLELTVHHYLEGTENKVPLGKDEHGEDIVAEDEHEYYKEGDHYKTNASEEVLQKYELVEVVGDEEKDIIQDEVVIYYYRIKKHEITTRVEIPEERAEDEKGGQISGEGEKPYEIVDHEETSTKDIIITPDKGYKIKQIRLVSTNKEGNKTESIIYGENAAENAEIKYTQSENGTVELTKFENMTEDKEVIVVFEPYEGRLIVHHYIENTEEKIYDDQVTIKPVGTKVETSPVKKGNYVLVKEPSDRKATITEETQEKTYYYQEQYKITTEVIKHSETYKDGTVQKSKKGGQIESEDKDSHELVLKNRSSQEEIEITPDSGCEIVNITIKDGKDAKEGINLDFEQYKEKDENGKETGKVILPAGLFPSMQSDKHIQVEFRKKTNVIVKHLEAGTENVLYKTEQGKDYEELKGYEGQEFETNRKVIPNYMAAEVEIIESTSEGEEHVTKAGITNENKEHMTKYSKVQTDEETYANGEMYADTLTIIYWYTRVPSGIIVRHIETNEKGEELEIESKLVEGLAGLEQPTTRNKYENYIPVDRKEENKGNANENVTIMSKDQNSKTLTFAEDKTLEVWYFYEKQYNVTTEVKPHEETAVNPETGKTETKQVDGGTISKKYEKDEQGNDKLDDKGNKIETVYEKILSRGDSKEEIEIKPDDGYRIKAVIKQKKIIVDGKETYEDEKVFIENMIKEDGSVVLPKGQLTDVQNDYNIVVEFERIPAKVIVEYKDAYTKETIHEDKEIPGFVKDEYNESRIEIENYIPANPEPENSAGKMTEDTITITYWYTKQFKVTTDVKEHEEDDGEGNKVSVKGGTILGEDETPYEIVTRGENSTKEITMKPEEHYRIKEVTINGIKMETKELLKEDGSITIPLFEDMQEDKHIVVEFERIPAKVIVEHLDEETNEPIVDKETLDGYVNKDYETEPKDLKYYELVKEKYPENDKGTMTEEDIIVKYYYRKLKFNMKIEKEISKITLNGKDITAELENNKYAKLEVEYKEIENTKIEVSYKIKVTNTEKVAGTAVVEEMIPEGFELVKEESDENWVSSSSFKDGENSIGDGANDRTYMLKTKELQPGETAEYKVTLRWKAENNNKGEKVNTAKIVKAENEPNYEETTLEDNEDKAIVEIRVKKTIQDVIDNIKDGKTDEAIKDAVDDVKIIAKDIVKNVKTGDPITISVITILIAGMAITITMRRKSINVRNKSAKVKSKQVRKGKHEK